MGRYYRGQTEKLSYSVFIDKEQQFTFTDYELFTYTSLSNITFSEIDVRKTITGLDLNKANGPDMMSDCMIKIGEDSIYKASGIILRTCLDHGVFPQNCRKEPKLLLFMNNITSNQKSTLGEFLFFHYVGKSLKCYCITISFLFSSKVT